MILRRVLLGCPHRNRGTAMILFLTFLAFATGCLLGARAVRPCPASQPHRHE
ncbi:hypothetical protein PY32053_02493 [Paracoccus yeei]|uniref:Lipoprotein n=1 Tax=Paracoccus yeei TaxID=147645 RepID=A0A386UPR6_9RHOB|nr:hypothetical protein PY32053_02493 [Paracoccus yeei]